MRKDEKGRGKVGAQVVKSREEVEDQRWEKSRRSWGPSTEKS